MAWVSPVEAMGRQVFEQGCYEPAVIALVRHFVRAGYSFVDVGANIGLHTMAAAMARPASWHPSGSQVFVAFEPEPRAFARLESHLHRNRLQDVVRHHRLAIGATSTSRILYASTTTNQGNHSLLARAGTVAAGEVEVVTLDSYLDALEEGSRIGDRPLLLKIDVEGFEPFVLEGGQDSLRRLANVAVLCEVSPNLLGLAGSSETDLLKRLDSLGFGPPTTVPDADTVSESGEVVAPFHNVFCVKGAQAEAMLARYTWTRWP
jgi:FkbM family methyltransferase